MDALLEGVVVPASVVVGFSEEEMITLQMDGNCEMVTDKKELIIFKNNHYQKIPDAKEYESDPETVFIKFIPHRWQYSDYNVDPALRISGTV